MRKTYFAKQKKFLYAISISLTIILLLAIVVNLLSLANIANLRSTNPVVDLTVSIVMIIVLIIINSFVFLSRYTIDRNNITCFIAYVIPYFKVSIDDILLIRMDSKKTILLLYIATTSDSADVVDSTSNLKANILQINIQSGRFDDFVSSVKDISPNVTVEIIDEEVQK